MSTFTGFAQEDFDVFSVEGLDARMDQIKSLIRPKLEYLGQHFAPALSLQTGQEMFYHVAKHARRTVNPPADTWVAWAADKRGYKKHPHFQLGMWGTHLFAWFALIYESPFKQEIGQAMEERIDEIMEIVPAEFRWSPDHTQPESTPQSQLGKAGVLQLIDRLQRVKKAEILCGITIDRHDPILGDAEKLLGRLEQTYSILTRVYHLTAVAVR
ncbi:YktB family protein [Brevibacillus sp. B_LB10_24]|uniref:YktB family protein n=1 Tax=Brevibacillus sp. B_LB10_24 TaxID=3380645 RepID=UPI0038BD0452